MPSLPEPPNKSSSQPLSMAAEFALKLPPLTQEFLRGQGALSDAPDEQAPAPNRRERRADIATLRASPRAVEPKRTRGPRKGSRRYRKQERERTRQADRRYLDRLHERLKAQGCKPPPADQLVGIPRHVWTMTQAITSDPSGRAVRSYAKGFRNKVAVGAVIVAALVPSEGTQRYTWRDLRARRIAALGFALIELSRPTNRTKDIYTRIVRGVPMGALRALLRDPFDGEHRPSRAAMAGTHRPGASLENGQVGYMKALREAGLLYSQQLPAHLCDPFERCGPSGRAINRYWVVGMFADAARQPARILFYQQLAAVAWDLVDGKDPLPRLERLHRAAALERRDRPPDG